MYIRLILTVREDKPKSYISNKVYKKSIVSNSLNKKLSNEINSIEILTKAYEYDPDNNGKKIDLIITPHNFFTFELNKERRQKEIEDKVKNKLREIAKELNNKLDSKGLKTIPLITGIDFIDSKTREFNSFFNPYHGIDSVVTYYNVNAKDEIEFSTFIWEVWTEKSKDYRDYQDNFKEQEANRIVCLNGKKFCLLSCGDIFKYCHKGGCLLPKADVYVDLAHKNLNLYNIFDVPKELEDKYKDKSPEEQKLLNNDLKPYIKGKKGEEKKSNPHIYKWLRQPKLPLFITQNLSRGYIKFLFDEDNNYFLICPFSLNLSPSTGKYFFDKNWNTLEEKKTTIEKKCNYIFFDVEINDQ